MGRQPARPLPPPRTGRSRQARNRSARWKTGCTGKKRKRASASGKSTASRPVLSMTWASRACAMPIPAATSAVVGTAGPWRRCNDRSAWRRALFAAAELAALARVDEADHAFAVIGAGRLAELFPFLDAFLLRRLVGRFLRIIARLVGDDRGSA